MESRKCGPNNVSCTLSAARARTVCEKGMRLRGDTALVQVHARNLRILELVLGGQVQPQLLDHEVARVQKQQLVVGVVHLAQKVREYLQPAHREVGQE